MQQTLHFFLIIDKSHLFKPFFAFDANSCLLCTLFSLVFAITLQSALFTSDG